MLPSRLSLISDRWFLTEPLLFVALCSHRLVENSRMKCLFRSGKMRIEFNPEAMDRTTDIRLEIMLRQEVLRILLKHPYQRQPLNPQPEVLTLASNITIQQHSDICPEPLRNVGIDLPGNLSFEEYYNLLSHLPDLLGLMDENAEEEAAGKEKETEAGASNTNNDGKENADTDGDPDCQDQPTGTPEEEQTAAGAETSEASQGAAESGSLARQPFMEALKDASALWEEDEWTSERMNQFIMQAMVTKQWGTVPCEMQQQLKASMERSLNVVRRLNMFRSSIVSTHRRLTRMRPSRRYGWGQMGVIHPYTTRLLIGIDTSGSVKTKDLARFYGVINRFFAYGIPRIDVMQFDADIHMPILSLKKAKQRITITGRGGTDFQPVIDYFDQHNEYDGLIIFTDGYAPTPDIPIGRQILWVLLNYQCYCDCAMTPKIYL